MANESNTTPPEGFMATPSEEMREIDTNVMLPVDLVIKALETKVGTEIGRFSIDKGLAQDLAEQLEMPELRNLPNVPLRIKKVSEDKYKITLGERTFIANADTMRDIRDEKFKKADEIGPLNN